MPTWFEGLSPVTQALIGGLMTWLLTLLGAAPVLLIKSVHRGVMDGMMGAAGGVMVAAACWSLLVPSLEVGGGASGCSIG